jgi:hypothetical protein
MTNASFQHRAPPILWRQNPGDMFLVKRYTGSGSNQSRDREGAIALKLEIAT